MILFLLTIMNDIENCVNINPEKSLICMSNRYGSYNGQKYNQDYEYRAIAHDLLVWNYVFQFEKIRWDTINRIDCMVREKKVHTKNPNTKKEKDVFISKQEEKELQTYKKKLRREIQCIQKHFTELYNILKENNENLITNNINNIRDTLSKY